MNNQKSIRPKVIYIMGTARSGSTILEILLSHGNNIFGAGEISSLIQDGFIDNKKCACDDYFHDCSIWGDVKRKLNFTKEQLNQWVSIQKKVDWHDGFLRQLVGMINTNEKHLYNLYNSNLLNVIQATAKADIIIDSSKYVGRAYALSQLPDIDLKIICLTRSPAGLMTSFQKPNKNEQKPKSTLSSLFYYCYTILTLRVVSLFLAKKVCFVQYESLLKSPVECIERIEYHTNFDLSVTKDRLKENKEFDVGHIVTGNRLRKKKKIFFENNKSCSKNNFNLIQILSISFMNIWKWMMCL